MPALAPAPAPVSTSVAHLAAVVERPHRKRIATTRHFERRVDEAERPARVAARELVGRREESASSAIQSINHALDLLQ